MEARLVVPIPVQEQLVAAASDAGGNEFPLPDAFSKLLIGSAYLGQLDVNPMGTVPGSRNERAQWHFVGRKIDANDANTLRLSITGRSDVAGGPDARGVRTDGRMWEHQIVLAWQGYVDIQSGRLTQLAMVARGDERLRWGNLRFQLTAEPDVQHLMAGHPIDLRCGVRYAIYAAP